MQAVILCRNIMVVPYVVGGIVVTFQVQVQVSCFTLLMSSNLSSTHIHWHRSSSQLLFSSSTGPLRIYERAIKSSS